MPLYKIHRLKEPQRQQFRWAPQISGITAVKLKDYEPDGEIQAAGEYAAWRQLRAEGRALAVGDLLEDHQGRLAICKYAGFDPARWFVPETTAAQNAGEGAMIKESSGAA